MDLDRHGLGNLFTTHKSNTDLLFTIDNKNSSMSTRRQQITKLKTSKAHVCSLKNIRTKIKFIEKEIIFVVTRRSGARVGNWRMVLKRYKLPAVR